ncbi:putative white-brown complex homolog protein 30 [Stylophora pistillata]|uniref:Putative white-brown complex-like protein 30 n=1 Tax=Stylophora pistillata TaxID=50429 RepID=A0A2B4RK32_STYPI|nr:putative white-brown complex homolog protein 30 [Stylophora pistillata]PFX16850.1 putative white-brown complex-like protein 30 [Stylophora pistillata]
MAFRLVIIIWFILGISVSQVVYGEKCGDVFDELLASCCPAKYRDVCCPFAKPCSTSAVTPTLSMVTSSPTQRSGGKPFCMKPQNSSACEAGFFFNKLSMKPEPCPKGFYCPQDQVCIIPCPTGAYCVRDKLVNATKKSPQLCRESGKCCSPSQSIPVFDPRAASKYICPGAHRPVPCPQGNFCPNVTIQKTCPGGYFCRNGSVEPQNCPILSICKKGSSAPVSAPGGVLLILGILVVMLLLLYCFDHEEQVMDLFESYLTKRFSVKRSFGMQESIRRNTMDKYREETEPKTQTITIRYENLSLSLKKGTRWSCKRIKTEKALLQCVSGQLLPGEVTAVMGPSGSGKTTFLNTLSGKAHYGKRTGNIFINDNPVQDLGVLRNITGFVPQEDIMHRKLTVKEVLIYQASLRLPSSISKEEKKKKVKEVLDQLDLAQVKNTKIGDEESRGISGGERKRVNIGMELVTDPKLLFLDEPTSGLDSTSSLTVVDALKAIAEEKKLTIVCVIHQPRYEIFSKFHKVLFLAPGGQTVFVGSVPEAENYFERLGFEKPDKVNPADFYMDVIVRSCKSTDQSSSTLPERWEQYIAENNTGTVNADRADGSLADPAARDDDRIEQVSFRSTLGRQNKERKMPNFLSQFLTFLRREIRLQLRLSRSLLLDQFLVLLAGGTLGALRREAPLDEFFTLVTLSSLAIGLTAMLSALRCFGSTRTIFWREAAAGVNRISYFVAVNVAQIPVILITPVVYLSLLYPLIAPRAKFTFHYTATLGVQFACTGVGYCISVIFSPKNSQMASVTFALISSLVAGSSPTLCKLAQSTFGKVIYSLSYCRWYLEALFEKEAIRYPDVMGPYVHRLSTRNGYTLDYYNSCVAVLFAMGFAYRVLALLLMLITNRGKQK